MAKVREKQYETNPRRTQAAPNNGRWSGRVIYEEEGEAYRESDVQREAWHQYDVFKDQYADKLTHWYPSARKNGYRDGDVDVFRILPGIRPVRKGDEQDSAEDDPWLPARVRPDGRLHEGVIRGVPVISKFGSSRKVTFIPCLPYKPRAGFPPYGGLMDNPYALLNKFLWSLKSQKYPKEWLPLLMTPKEIDEYRKQAKLSAPGSFRSQALIPYRTKLQYFVYAHIYKSYNTSLQEAFEFQGTPFGAEPGEGLQVFSFNDQVYSALSAEYRKEAQSESQADLGEFYWPDPAYPDKGTLNYIWNGEKPHPLTGKPGDAKVTMKGYSLAVSRKFHLQAKRGFDVDLRLEADFLDWYYENWQPWTELLKGTYAEESVALIAKYFPELKSVVKRAWNSYPELMAAWDREFAGAPDNYDFYEILRREYNSNSDIAQDGEDAGGTGTARSFSQEDYTTSTRRNQVLGGSKVTAPLELPEDILDEEEEDDEDYDTGGDPDTETREIPERFRRTPSRPPVTPPAKSRRTPPPAEEEEYDEEDEEEEKVRTLPRKQSPLKVLGDRMRKSRESGAETVSASKRKPASAKKPLPQTTQEDYRNKFAEEPTYWEDAELEEVEDGDDIPF
jgi:hypothetical protein